jgi:hypothetical protein
MKEFIEKLISRLEETKAENEPSVNGKTTTRDLEVYKITIDYVKKIVKELAEEYESNLSESLTSWIPCSEKQPNKDGYYLVTTSDEEIDVREYDYSKGWGWDGFERIIAWQPLPEPFITEKAEWKEAVMQHFTKVD